MLGLIQKAAASLRDTDYAPGLPDPKTFGDLNRLRAGKQYDWIVQRHEAERAGLHRDVRLGDKETGLYSWATKKDFPEPGARPISLFQQPVHRHSYKDFEGTIEKGYGKGTVEAEDKGRAIIQSVSPTKIKFALIHGKNPEEFTLIRVSGRREEGTERTKRTQGGTWLMLNTTPTEPVTYKKVKYKTIPASEIDKLFDQDYVMSHKIDGSAAFVRLVKDHAEALSYRASSEGKPIIHTHRIGLSGERMNIPESWQGKVLRGEIYGTRDNAAIPVQELGGLLNASTAKSLDQQKANRVKMRMALFDILDESGVEKGLSSPRSEIRAQIQEALKFLPDTFHEPEYAYTKAEKKKMWKAVTSNKDPLTREGVVGFPTQGGTPVKVKPRVEADVWVRNTFPGEGKYKGRGAGGFEYSLSPSGPIVGKVGTGIDDKTRKDMWEHPEDFVGRMARIEHQEQFPSGAYRAPSYIALHEDYPLAKSSAASRPIFGAALIASTLSTLATNAYMSSRLRNKLNDAPKIRSQEQIKRILSDVGVPESTPVFKYPGMNNAAYVGRWSSRDLAEYLKADAATRRRMRERGTIIYDPAWATPGIMAHEAGHAEVANRNFFSPSRINQQLLRPVANVVSPIATIVAGAAAIKTGNPIAAFVAPAATSLVGSLPTLISEYQASNSARRHIDDSRMREDTKDTNRKVLRNAYATYLVGGLLPGAILGTGALLSQKFD